MFMFRGLTEEAERVRKRIRRMFECRDAMHISELRLRLGGDRTVVQAELEAMIECGEVVRLRPIDYPREDQDVFRMNGPDAMAKSKGKSGYNRILHDVQEPMQLADAAILTMADSA